MTIKGKYSEAKVVTADVEADGVGEWASRRRRAR